MERTSPGRVGRFRRVPRAGGTPQPRSVPAGFSYDWKRTGRRGRGAGELPARLQAARANSTSGRAFGTWLYRIAANCSLDLVRSRKRRSRTSGAGAEGGAEMEDPVLTLPSPDPKPGAHGA